MLKRLLLVALLSLYMTTWTQAQMGGMGMDEAVVEKADVTSPAPEVEKAANDFIDAILAGKIDQVIDMILLPDDTPDFAKEMLKAMFEGMQEELANTPRPKLLATAQSGEFGCAVAEVTDKDSGEKEKSPLMFKKVDGKWKVLFDEADEGNPNIAGLQAWAEKIVGQ